MSWEILLPVLGLSLAAIGAAITAASAAAITAAAAAPSVELYVSPEGDDAHPGTLAEPFATLEGARDRLRRLQEAGSFPGATVYLRGGRYELARPFALSAEDAGREGAPIVYRAYPGEEVVLSGGRTIAAFRPVEDPQVLARLPEIARGRVLQADLKDAGVDDFGEVAAPGNRLELFFGGRPMTLARWPDEGFVRVDSVFNVDPFKVHGIDGDRVGKFTYEGDRPSRWLDEPEVWLHGYWFWDWSDQPQKVKSIDPENRVIELEEPYHNYGYRPGQRFYALNLLGELDRPGEWYLDRQRGLLYFWPPEETGENRAPGSPVPTGSERDTLRSPEETGETRAPVSLAPTGSERDTLRSPEGIEGNRAVVSLLPGLISLKNTSWVAFHGLHLEATRGTAVTVSGGEGVQISGCTIRNTGSWAVRVEGGARHAVIGCDILQTGEGGIALSGGDRQTLTPCHHLADNNHITRFGRVYRTYRPAVGVDGVGVRVAHNLIHDGPHNAIQLSGNDHLIEFNEIYDVCYETGDVGAFYMGRDWTARGTIIRHNFFHQIRGPGLHGAMAVYLDDAASGIQIVGNLFYRASRAAFIGGGRDNRVENNIFVECEPAVHVDDRGLNWMAYHVEPGGIMPERLAAVPYREEPWRSRYPELLTLLDDQPGAPKGNLVRRNISVGGRWADIYEKAQPLVILQDNLVDQDPGFVDPEHLDFRLRPDSPAWQLGFQAIPVEQIGLYPDEWRASWPVEKTRRSQERE